MTLGTVARISAYYMLFVVVGGLASSLWAIGSGQSGASTANMMAASEH
ncbi:hypothetical protein [Ciceribacter sp. L1K22]|nr:hypothetical protein [Ciceribacter sp. L1K22]MBO3760423.1 hypothetical protein [Ciceribacter sp. L1K22]